MANGERGEPGHGRLEVESGGRRRYEHGQRFWCDDIFGVSAREQCFLLGFFAIGGAAAMFWLLYFGLGQVFGGVRKRRIRAVLVQQVENACVMSGRDWRPERGSTMIFFGARSQVS